jgi:hypothetical protein
MENSVLESIRRTVLSLYAANLVNSGDKQGRKVMKETIADKSIGSRHAEKGICKKDARERTAERLARASKMTHKGQRQPCIEAASSMWLPINQWDIEQQSKTWWEAGVPTGSQRA